MSNVLNSPNYISYLTLNHLAGLPVGLTATNSNTSPTLTLFIAPSQ